MSAASSRDIRSELDHPVVDGDGHVIEATPVLKAMLGTDNAHWDVPLARRFGPDAAGEVALPRAAG